MNEDDEALFIEAEPSKLLLREGDASLNPTQVPTNGWTKVVEGSHYYYLKLKFNMNLKLTYYLQS